MEIVIDIETIPDQSEGAIERYMTGEAKCPFKSKGEIGADLGMSPEEYKFIGAEDFKRMWVDKKGSEALKAQAEEKWLKTSFDGAYGQVISICASDLKGNDISVSYHHECEYLLIKDFWDKLEELTCGKPPYFVAHNAKFDLPFLYHRSVIKGIKPARGFNGHGRHGSDYFCTMEAWAGYNGKIGLDRLSGILGLGSKTEGMSGADVWPEYQNGNLEKIASYCADDVKLTAEVYKRLTFK